jgi:general secretion pathway protein G
MTGTINWGLRSAQDDPDTNSWGGQDVFDVFTTSAGTALDGTKYSDW